MPPLACSFSEKTLDSVVGTPPRSRHYTQSRPIAKRVRHRRDGANADRA